MMNKKNFSILIFIFFLAFILRLILILTTKPYPIYFWSDEGYYNDTANAIYGILSHFNIFVREFLSGRLGKGEGILNTHGLRLPFGIFHRGIIHPVFLAILYLLFGLNNFKAVWFIQGILDSFSCVLIYLIGKRIFTKRVAFLASILTVIYIPLMHYTTMLMQETLITFLLLLTIFLLIRALQDNSLLSFLVGGFCLFLVTTGRLAYMYLFWVMFICIFYILSKEKNIFLWRRAIAGILIGFLIPLLLWMTLICLEFGKFGKIMVGPGASNLYRSNIISTQGWPTDEDRLRFGPHLTQRLRDQGFIWDDSKAWPPDKILFKATLNEVKRNPKGTILLFFEKARKLWLLTDYDSIARIIHNPLVLFIIISIPLAFLKSRISILLSSIIIYITLVHSIIAAEPRYNLPGMPFVFLISCFTLNFVWKSFSIQDKKDEKRTILFCLLSIAFYLLSKIFTVPILILIFNKIKPESAFIINILLKNIFILLISVSIYLIFSATLAKYKRITVAVLSYFCFAILFNSWAIFDKSWREWDVLLSCNNQAIKQEIVIPQMFLNSADKAFLKIDMEQSSSPIGKLFILVNGEIIKEYDKELTVDNGDFLYFEYDYVIKNLARMRRWFSVPLKILVLKKSSPIKIELVYEESLSNNKGWIALYGDYPIEKNGSVFVGPLFAKNSFETSIKKYYLEGDYRLNGRVKLLSQETNSRFFNGKSWSSSDLSQRPGIQSGQYRIRLEIIDNQGNSLIF